MGRPRLPRNCVACGKDCRATTRAKKVVYCSPECVKEYRDRGRPSTDVRCHACDNAMTIRGHQRTNFNKTGRSYCSPECMEKFKYGGKRTITKEFRERSSKRMKERNPMWMPGVKEKMIESSKGRTFLSRGGNGEHTKHQLMLHLATGLPMEHVIETAAAKGVLPSLPHHYKVDLAAPEVKLAIEVDGKTHRLRKWRFLDHRKTTILNSLGWQVLRFTNEQVEGETKKCVKTILSTISRLSTTTTTSPTAS